MSLVKQSWRLVLVFCALWLVVGCNSEPPSNLVQTINAVETALPTSLARAEAVAAVPTFPPIPTPQPTEVVAIPTPLPTAEVVAAEAVAVENETVAAEDGTATPAAPSSPIKRVVIGAPSDVEQNFLAHLTVLQLQQAGYEVVLRAAVGDVADRHALLRDGDIDVLWASAGEVLQEIHQVPGRMVSNDPDLSWETVAALDETHHDLRWLPRALFGSGYGVLIRPNTFDQAVTSIEDLRIAIEALEMPPVVCVDTSFYEREDGWSALQAAYDLAIDDAHVLVDAAPTERLWTEECLLAVGQRANARRLVALDDTAGFFQVDSVAPLVRQSTLADDPQLGQLLDLIGLHADDDMMAVATASITLGNDGEPESGDEADAAVVAEVLLREAGLINNRPKVTIGSINFTEQYLLGYLSVVLLEQNGYTVEDRVGGWQGNEAYEALRAGEIDVYWAYTGNILAGYFGWAKLPADPDEAWQAVSEQDAVHDLRWLPPGNFNDTHTLFVNPAQWPDSAEINTITELATFMNRNSSPLSVCVDADFHARGDGLLPMQAWYQFAFAPENIQIVEHDALYSHLRDGLCDVSQGFRTDGRVAAWGLKPLQDDLRFFPAYNAAPIVRESVAVEDDRLTTLLTELSGHLNDEAVTELNARIDVGADGERDSGDEQSARAVAEAFLCDVGLILCRR